MRELSLPENKDWIIPDWPAPANVKAIITTRAGGISTGQFASFNIADHVGDDACAVAENRQRLRQSLPSAPLWLMQVHGKRVVPAENTPATREADASVSDKPGTVLAIQTADCLPVLLCDRAGTRVGAAHAGWRGLCSGVIEATVHAMNRPGDALLAYLGPAIGPRHFEVGAEVRAAFLGHDFRAAEHFLVCPNGKWLANLYGLARQRLATVGVMDVYGGGFCTFAEQERFFSYRRDGVTGRMAALIWKVS